MKILSVQAYETKLMSILTVKFLSEISHWDDENLRIEPGYQQTYMNSKMFTARRKSLRHRKNTTQMLY